jgi:uncharacterized protein (TIGR03437 family)
MQSRRLDSDPGKLLRIALVAAALAMPALGESYCVRTFEGYAPNLDMPAIWSATEKYAVFSDGVYMGSVELQIEGGAFIYYNGKPFNSAVDPDVAGELPNEFQTEYDADEFLDLWCSMIVDLGDFSRPSHPHWKTRSSATAHSYGQAAGLFVNADFNGDGIPDSAQSASGQVVVSLYNSSGQVSSSATYNVGQASGQILAGDFNGDGKMDLAVIVTSSASAQGNVAILLGKGDGTFGAPASFPAGPYPSPFVIADFNKDGKLDLAVGGETGNSAASIVGSVSILLGKGDGTFAAPASIKLGTGPSSIVATDFTGDGNVDLAVLDPGVSQTGASLWMLLGNGDGTFRTPIGGLSGTGQGSLSYTDLNGDGKPDLLVADFDYSAIAALLGKGDGTFQATQSYVAAAQPASVAVIPLQDGTTALFTGDALSNRVLLNVAASNGVISAPPLQVIGAQPAGIAAADVNGDGKPDVVWTDGGASKVYVLLNTGQGQVGAPVTYSVGNSLVASAVADVNNDGKPDLVVQDGNGIDVLLNNGNGTFGPVQSSPVPAGPSPSVIVVADFNSDGKPDVAALNSSGSVSILLGKGNGGFSPGTSIPLPGGATPAGLAAADFNSDGNIDLAVSYNPQDTTQNGSVVALLGDGQGGFRSSATIALPGIAGGVAVADINRDGKPDLLARAYGPNVIGVALGNGDGAFRALSSVTTETGGPGITVVDLNGDGIPDMALSDCCGLTEASYMLGKGDGTFQPEIQFPSGANPQFVATADFDGDGFPDLAIAGSADSHGTLVTARNPRGVKGANAPLTVASAAGGVTALAPGSLVASYGSKLSTGPPAAPGLPWPTSANGSSVTILDSAGVSTKAPLTYVSSRQVNFQIPDRVATGLANVTVTSGGTKSGVQILLTTLAPALFTLNSSELAAAYATCVSSSGAQTVEDPFQVVNGALVPRPLNLGACSETVLELYGTGLDAAKASAVQVTIGGDAATVLFAGPGGGVPGLDQVNVAIPKSLAGAGNVTVQVTASGIAANPVQITIQ